MDLKRLRSFVTVADCGTVSAAAVRLRITQPALSRQLHDLQAEFGVPLFDQVGRRLRLSAEAEQLLPQCRALLGQADGLLESARALTEGNRGELRVGITPHMAANLLPGLIGELARRLPLVQLHGIEGGGLEHLAALRRGDIHAAVAVPEGDMSDLVGHPIPPIYALAVASAATRLRPPVDIASLAGLPLLLLRSGFGTRRTFDAACRMDRMAPRIAHESSATETLIAMARAGHGIAIISSAAHIARPGLMVAPVLFRGRPLVTGGALYWNPQYRRPPYADTFSEIFIAHLRRTMFPVSDPNAPNG